MSLDEVAIHVGVTLIDDDMPRQPVVLLSFGGNRRDVR